MCLQQARLNVWEVEDNAIFHYQDLGRIWSEVRKAVYSYVYEDGIQKFLDCLLNPNQVLNSLEELEK